MEDMVFINFNTPSLKNGKIATSRGVFSSKTVQKYLRKHGIQHYSCSKKTITTYKTIPMIFPVDELRKLFDRASYPIVIGMHFVRDSNRSFDFNNANSLIMDLFTAFDIIESNLAVQIHTSMPLDISSIAYFCNDSLAKLPSKSMLTSSFFMLFFSFRPMFYLKFNFAPECKTSIRSHISKNLATCF